MKSGKQILYINAHMLNLEKWYRQSYLQSWNRHADVENKYKDTKGERGQRWDDLGDSDWHVYTSDTKQKIDK